MTSPIQAAVVARRAFIQRIGSLVLVAAILVTTACGGDSGGDKTTGPGPSVAGNYNLRTIDGDAPPVEVYHGPWFDGVNRRFYNQMVLVLRNGAINLDETDHWSMTFDADVTLDGKATRQTVTATGTYQIDDGDITLSTVDGGTPISGTIKKGNISVTMDVEGNKQFKAYSFTR